jgi:hypothetical protein
MSIGGRKRSEIVRPIAAYSKSWRLFILVFDMASTPISDGNAIVAVFDAY